jgi:serine protease
MKQKMLLLSLFFAGSILSTTAQTNKPNLYAVKKQFKLPAQLSANEYLPNAIIIKINSAYRNNCNKAKINDVDFTQLFQAVGGQQLHLKFPNAKAPEKEFNNMGLAYADLSLVYEFTFNSNSSLEKVVNLFNSLRIAEYAEPHFIPHVSYTPNDTYFGNQWGLTNIQAANAWGVNTTTARGDTNVVIGITDTGTEPTHNDLKNNIKKNYADPINGIDDDNDGYIDNFRGWDVGMDDNDPTWQGNAHGVHVCGIAAAQTDNSTGVAGTGFKCKFLPVKIADASGALIASYEGITYAADHGCKVINCSWGGTGGGQLGQDVITYATINKDALVVASAGNSAIDEGTFPASYQYVISVCNTKTDDRRAGTSTYNYTVDVGAPGESIPSTYSGGTYTNLSGTSMASPCAAGVAAIIRSFYPSFNALQTGERLKTTTDTYPSQSPIYTNKLGTGRVNMYKAITNTLSPSVVMINRNDTDNNDNTFVIGDSIRVSGTFNNYLAATTNLTATLSTTSIFVTILDATTTLGAIPTLGSNTNNPDPFIFKINAGTPQNSNIIFKLTMNDAATGYTTIQYFTITVNVDYINIRVNDVATSVGSNGRIGYSQTGQTGGLGFNYMNGGTLLYEAGLMIGKDAATVSDGVRGAAAGSTDADFVSVTAAKIVLPAVISDFDVSGVINDNGSTAPLPVTVQNKTFAWATQGDRKYVIFEYTIKNMGTVALNNLFAGVFADWDIDAVTYASNRSEFDAALRMGYSYYTGAAGKYCGIKLLTTSAPVVHYAVDNLAGGGGGVDLSDGYGTDEKYTTLSTNKINAGMSGSGVDVIDVVSTGPYSLNANDSVRVAFALIAGDDLTDLQTSATNAQIKYDGIYAATSVNNATPISNELTVFPNPSKTNSIVNFSLPESSFVDLRVFNNLGQEVTKLVTQNLTSGVHQYQINTEKLSAGSYYIQLKTANSSQMRKFFVTH